MDLVTGIVWWIDRGTSDWCKISIEVDLSFVFRTERARFVGSRRSIDGLIEEAPDDWQATIDRGFTARITVWTVS
jgi:hypothetical protein